MRFTAFRRSLSSFKYLGPYVGIHFAISRSLRAGPDESLNKKQQYSRSRQAQAVVSSPVGRSPNPPWLGFKEYTFYHIWPD
jgi:hypothetical protein